MKPIIFVRAHRKNSFPLLILLMLLVSVFSSCEKVIDINLDSAEKKYVIEAIVTDQPGGAHVQITQTKDFADDSFFPGVDGAVVTISESGGPITPLVRTRPGEYEAPALVGTTGKTYTLSVTIGTRQFNAVAVMPQRTNLDTIFVTDELLFTDVQKIANAVFTDPVGRGNSYRFVQYVNDEREDQITIINDEYTDGRSVTAKLFYFSDDDDDDKRKIKSGDEVRIEMQCIDPVIYKYWFSLLRSSTGTSGQATPANPVTNMQGGALGYFSAQTFQEKKMIVP